MLQTHCGATALQLRHDLPTPGTVEVVDALAELESRRADLVPTGGLRGKSVVLAAAGSIGSCIAVTLAQAGVGQFLVIDPDELDASNVSRHACDLSDVGRSKARAVSDLLSRRLVSAECLDQDLLDLPEDVLDRLVASADVVVATTDSQAAQFAMNESCVRSNTRGVFVAAYERACGGEVIVVQPGAGPCLFCTVGFRAQLGDGIGVKERKQAYQDASANDLQAEPGLGADIAYLSSVAAAYVLALLDPGGSRDSLKMPARSLTLLHGGSQPRGSFSELFEVPFDLIQARVQRSDPCPVCGWMSDSR